MSKEQSSPGAAGLLAALQRGIEESGLSADTTLRLKSILDQASGAWESLAAERDKYRDLYQRAPVGYLSLDRTGKILEANLTAGQMLGLPRDDLVGMLLYKFSASDQCGRLAGHLMSTCHEGGHWISELELVRIDGTRIWVQMESLAREDEPNGPLRTTISDITGRKRAELALAASEERYRSLGEASPDVIFIVDPQGVFQYFNQAAAVHLERSPEELVGLSEEELFPPDVARMHREAEARVVELDGMVTVEDHFTLPSGEFWQETRLVPLHDQKGRVSGILGIARDISERKRAEDVLKEALREKELLLREIHHRVKNNMQVVSSLLILQTEQVSDPALRKALTVSQNRVKTMALIHESLYRTESLAAIIMQDYLERLCGDLYLALASGGVRISFDIQARGVVMNIDQAVPCGLIINELVTNAIKYAFEPGGQGRISIRARLIQPHRLEIRVADDGQGLPPDFDLASHAGLGLSLVQGLAEKQLKGSFSLGEGPGVQAVVKIPLSEPPAMPGTPDPAQDPPAGR